ncbi:MAG TPA: MarR family transcriptional regulator [Vicinamibacterales bacterium]|nr:MarR family transcriptional regulator [Vicinamibacterales bacterium]
MGSNTSGAGATQTALDAIRRIVQSLRESSRWSERHVGLSGAQRFVLQKLADAPGISINELAARTHTHQSSVSTVVTRLVQDGLVRRAPSGSDGRSVTLSLSARGRRAAERSPDVPQERLIRAIEQLTATRRRQLAAALTEVAKAMDSAGHAPAMFFEEHSRAHRGTRRE